MIHRNALPYFDEIRASGTKGVRCIGAPIAVEFHLADMGVIENRGGRLFAVVKALTAQEEAGCCCPAWNAHDCYTRRNGVDVCGYAPDARCECACHSSDFNEEERE